MMNAISVTPRGGRTKRRCPLGYKLHQMLYHGSSVLENKSLSLFATLESDLSQSEAHRAILYSNRLCELVRSNGGG